MSDLTGQIYVLCHGAWHGGWCWREVAAALRKRGAEVHCPTMTGLGDRQHLREACRGLSTYIDDVCTLIALEGLRDIILVGHSFGGMCISGVADRLPDRIKHLVYLDAAVPQHGQSMITQGIANSAEVNAAITASLESRRDQWLPPASLELIGVDSAPDWVQQRERACMTDHPISSLIDPLHFVNDGPTAPATYIVCDNPPMPGSSFVAHYQKVLAGDYGPHWKTRRIDSGHMCMFTALDETVAMLAEAALIV